MKRSAATWKRVAMSLRGLKEQPRSSHGTSAARRQLRVERLQARELLAADTLHEPVLQYTGGITIAGEVASPDVNQDGNINPLDALVVANALNASWGVEQLPAADLNQDQQLDHQDFTTIVQTLQQQGNLVAAKGVQADAAAVGNGTVLDDTCAANEITIAMLQDHVEVLKAELAVTVDPMQRAFLEANIASFESSIASMQEDLNCGSGGDDDPSDEDPGEDDGSGTAGSEGTAGSGGSGGTVGSEGTVGSGGSEGGSPDGPPDPPPTDPPDEPTNETPDFPPTEDPDVPDLPADPGDPPGESPQGPTDGLPDEQPGDLPPLPPDDPEIPPELPDDTPTGGGTDGTLGGPFPPQLPPTDIPPDEIPPSDDPPADIPPDEIPPGEGTLGGGGNTGATEFYVKELNIVPQGYSQGIHGSQIPPLHEAEFAEIRGTIDGPREYGELLTPPSLTLQVDLNSDGDYDDPGEQTHIESGPTNNSDPASVDPFYNDEFYWSVPLADDGPVPGDGEISNVIMVRAFFGELGDEENDTTNKGLPSDNDPGPDEIPEQPTEAGPRITSASAKIMNVDPYWTRTPEFSWQRDDDGNPVAHWDIGYNDVGQLDAHTLQVRWGDGPAELLDATPVEHEDCVETSEGIPCTHEQTVLVAQQAPASAPESESVTLTVTDDDTGVAQYTILNLDVLRNNDDDDGNDISDLLDPGHETENDLKRLKLSKLFTDQMDPNSENYRKGKFELQYDPQAVRVWDSALKKKLILPFGLNMEDAIDNASRVSPNTVMVPYTGQSRVWVEGLTPSVSNIHLNYRIDESPASESDLVLAGHTQVTVWGIDADIDSDNDDGHNQPDHSDWEEYLEDSDYAIGKLLYEQHPNRTPFAITLPPGLDLSDPNVKVSLTHPTPFQSGTILLWRQSNYIGVTTNLLLANGSVEPVSENTSSTDFSGVYTLEELGYDPLSGSINLFIDLLDVTDGHNTKLEVDLNGKPDDRIKAELVGTKLTVPPDEVKWMAVSTFHLDLVDKSYHTNSFYNFVNDNQAIRNAFAADLVYGDRTPTSLPTDKTKYPMKWVAQNEKELRAILDTADLTEGALSSDEKDYLVDIFFYREKTVDDSSSHSVLGLGVGLYLDHVSGNYVLAFRGTNPDEMIDWIENLSQLLANYSPQYEAASLTTAILKRVPMLNNMQITGHSLGGGLASAASITTGLHADTFNASGLVKGTLKRPVSGIEYEPGALERFNEAEKYIASYQVYWAPLKHEDGTRDAPDILSYLQNHLNFVMGPDKEYLPDARGQRIAIEGIHDLTDREMEFIERLSNFFRHQDAKTLAPLLIRLSGKKEGVLSILTNYFSFDRTDALNALSKMIDSHGFESIYHGLLYNKILTPRN